MKDNDTVISEFNEYVNMTASELQDWLKTDDSSSAGWPKDSEGGGGESVGQDSGHKIVEILKANPAKEADKYTDEQVQHMRKVAAYCKRHLAQEAKGNADKDPEAVKKTKSYISLKNWGHDFLKAQGKESGSSNGGQKPASENGEEAAEDNESAAGESDEQAQDKEETGDKRKRSSAPDGANKTRKTGRQTRSSAKKDEDEEDEDGEEENDKDEDMEEHDGSQEETNGGGKASTQSKGAKHGPKKGETVSWNWGSGQPEGKVLDVKEEKATIKTKRGNEVSRNGDPEDPAVILDTGKSKAIKSAHELN